jgi:hypothetical protein
MSTPTLISRYLKTGQAFILVYSVTDKESFTGIQKFKSRLWAAKDKDEKDTVPMVVSWNEIFFI